MLDVPKGLTKREEADHRRALIIQRYRNGMSRRAIAAQYGVTRQYVHKVIHRFAADVAMSQAMKELGRKGLDKRYGSKNSEGPV